MATLQGQPVVILPEGSSRLIGRDAQRTNIMVAKAIANAVRTTLGPKGMDKMLVDDLGDVTITNDGATILKDLDIAHPAGKMLVEVAKTQDSEVGDGTTTSVVLAGELLKEAAELIDKDVHSSMIVRGYRLAAEKAIKSLKELAEQAKGDKMLKEIAIVSMTGKGVEEAREYLADLVVEAVKTITETEDDKVNADIDLIKVEKKVGGDVEESSLISGIVIDKERVHSAMPRHMKEAKIALVDSAFEVKSTETDAKISITSAEQMQAFIDQEEEMLKEMVDKVKSAGANVLFCQKGIDDLAQHYLAKEGIFAVRRVKESDMEKLALATGAKIVTRIKDLSSGDLGYAQSVEERKIAGEEMTFVEGCKNPKAVTILIRGGTEHVIDEVERILHDAICVVGVVSQTPEIVVGGGAIEVELAMILRKFAKSIGGREQLAIESFANALEVIPRTLAESSGLDPIDILVSLRASHEKGQKYVGVDVMAGKVADMRKKGVIEPMRVKKQAISSATEATEMILRIDDVIASKGEGKTPKTPPGGGMPPGMGGMPGMM